MLQIFTSLSPTGKYTTVVPLCLMISVSMLREALEDRKRHKDDARVNGRAAKVLRGAAWATLRWRDLRVGDIVRCDDLDEFPADLLILSTSKESGMREQPVQSALHLLEDSAPSASLDDLKAQAAPTHATAQTEHMGGLPWPQEPASGLSLIHI